MSTVIKRIYDDDDDEKKASLPPPVDPAVLWV